MLFETRGLVHACTNVTFLTTTILIATPPKIYCRPLQKKSGLRPGIINLSRIIHPYNHNRMIQLSLKSNPYPFRRPPRSAVRVGLLVDSTVAGHFILAVNFHRNHVVAPIFIDFDRTGTVTELAVTFYVNLSLEPIKSVRSISCDAYHYSSIGGSLRRLLGCHGS